MIAEEGAVEAECSLLIILREPQLIKNMRKNTSGY